MFIAIDGDRIGKRLEQYILEGDKKNLQCFSQSVTETISALQQLIKNNHGEIYMCGGDNLFAECSRDISQVLMGFINSLNCENSTKFSVAFGESLQDTYLALKYAKSSQKQYIKARREEGDLVFFQIKY